MISCSDWRKAQKYSVDIVFCIDATGAMGNVIYEIRQMITHLSAILAEELEWTGQELGSLRARVIYFRDFVYDDDPIGSSQFYNLPEETDQLQAFVNGIEAFGGGDEPENALEALAEAMDSDWMSYSRKCRQIIMMFTDAGAHKLEESFRDHPQYRKDMPTSLYDLEEWWEGHTPNGKLKETAKRLILFAPDEYPWEQISCWNKTEWWKECFGGCADVDEKQIQDMVLLAMREWMDFPS